MSATVSTRPLKKLFFMMTSSNGNIFRVTGPLCGEFSGHRFLWSALMASVICTGTNGRVNNQDAGDLRRHSVHYDVTVMQVVASQGWFTIPSIIPRQIVIMRIIFWDGNDIWYLCESVITVAQLGCKVDSFVIHIMPKNSLYGLKNFKLTQ